MIKNNMINLTKNLELIIEDFWQVDCLILLCNSSKLIYFVSLGSFIFIFLDNIYCNYKVNFSVAFLSPTLND